MSNSARKQADLSSGQSEAATGPEADPVAASIPISDILSGGQPKPSGCGETTETAASESAPLQQLAAIARAFEDSAPVDDQYADDEADGDAGRSGRTDDHSEDRGGPPEETAGPNAPEPSSGAEAWQRKRQFARYDLPLIVEITGHRYQVSDWSLGGFCIEGAADLGIAGDRTQARVIIQIEDFDLGFQADIELVRLDMNSRSAAFRFCGLADEQVSTLSRVSEAMMSGRIKSVDGMLRYVDRAQAKKAAEERQASSPFGVAKRFGALLLAVFLCVVAARAAILQTLSIDAAAAWPAQPSVTLSAPAPSRVAATHVQEFDRIQSGVELLRLEDARLDSELAVREADLERDTIRLTGLEATFARRLELLEVEQTAAQRVLDRASDRLAVAARAVEAARDYHADRRSLFDRGVVPRSSVQEADRQRLEAINVMAEAERDFDQARSRLNAAEAGYFFGNNRSTGYDPASLELEITQLRRDLAAQHTAIDGLRARQSENMLVSPCDCVVVELPAQVGERLNTADPAVVLRPVDAPAALVAFIRHREAGAVETGQRATVRLADGRVDRAARIVEVRNSVRYSQEIDLLARNLNPERFAEIRIVLSDPYRNADVSGAEVVIVNSAVGWLERLLFLRF